MERRTERDPDTRHSRHLPTRVQHSIHAFEADGGPPGYRVSRRSFPRRIGMARFRLRSTSCLREKSVRTIFVCQLAHVAQRFEGARFALRDRKRVEEPGRWVIVQTIGETSTVEILLEEFRTGGCAGVFVLGLGPVAYAVVRHANASLQLAFDTPALPLHRDGHRIRAPIRHLHRQRYAVPCRNPRRNRHVDLIFPRIARRDA
jgi:hypothetical protein